MALEKLRSFFGLQSPESQKPAAAGPKKTVEQINEEFARKMTPEVQKKFKDRRAQNATEEVLSVKSNLAEELKNIKNQALYFGQLDLINLSADELAKVTKQIEKQIEAIQLLPLSDETKGLKALLEEKKAEIISTLSGRIERQTTH